jgi:hypothetical protein
VQWIVGRFGRRVLWCALGAMPALGPGTARAADACSQSSVSWPNNPCQNQVQGPVSYGGWQTQSWAYYCAGDHPYFAIGNNGIAWDNTCFTNTENQLKENDNFDGDFTNWCIGTQSLVVTLACYQFKPD